MARVFSGIQPSGELHIGNYLGAVKNWVRLQDAHDCIYCVVDLHAITQPYDPAGLAQRTHDMAVGLLAAGIDPGRSILFVQSHVAEHSELSWILTTVTPLGELERQTQYKDKAQRQESVPAGLLSYPVLQAADVLLYQAALVPVGEDQVQHLELMREIARRWNTRYAADFFPEPQPQLTATKRVLGLDGQAKMSKSLGNTIGLLESPEAIWAKLKPAATDPARVTRKDPGNPEICNVFTIHQGFSPPAVQAEVAQQCRTAGWGCLDCKRVLADHMIAELTPIRERAAELNANPVGVRTLLREGAERARGIARRTLREVHRHMGFLKSGED
jgi:tryptophanyl-tRNA synthetase